MKLMKSECPDGVGYATHLWAYAARRYQVEASSQLTAVITFKCNFESNAIFSRPQVWFNSPDPEEDITSPPFTFSYSTARPVLGETFDMTVVVDTSKVPAGRDVMGFRPQLGSGGWTSNVDVKAPIEDYKFSCERRFETGVVFFAPGKPS